MKKSKQKTSGRGEVPRHASVQHGYKASILRELASQIRETSDQLTIPTSDAFNRVAAEWLGFDVAADHFSDGAGDKGIDFWFESESGFDIYQCKTHELTPEHEIDTSNFDNEGVLDLGRAMNFLCCVTDTENDRLKPLVHQWNHAIAQRRSVTEEESKILTVNLGLVILGESLTSPAANEFSALCHSIAEERDVSGVQIQFRAALYTVEVSLPKIQSE